MGKKLTRRESREAAFLTAFAATFEPEMPSLPADEAQPEVDAFANSCWQLCKIMLRNWMRLSLRT